MNLKALLAPFIGVLFILTLFFSVFGHEGGLVTTVYALDIAFFFGGLIYIIISQQLFTYVIRRLIDALVSMLVIATALFMMLRFLPGGPFDNDKALPPEVKANIEAKYHLNDPLYVQYIDYMTGIAKGDLGESYKYLGRSVTDIIVDTFPVSFQLGMYALIISFMVGIPLGVWAASKHNSWQDNFAMILAMSGVSLPSFLVAAIFILVFSFWLGVLPPALWDGPEYYLMPVIVLGIRPAAYIARLTRSSCLDVIHSDFVRTAKAKGVGRTKILFKHVLKNSLIPVLTYSGPLLATILSGTFIIELVFAVPGMGKHFIQSVTNRDYPLIMGLTLLFGFMMIMATLIVDLFYAVIDPRIRLK
jgi:oligopeptide transport system permease protein